MPQLSTLRTCCFALLLILAACTAPAAPSDGTASSSSRSSVVSSLAPRSSSSVVGSPSPQSSSPRSSAPSQVRSSTSSVPTNTTGLPFTLPPGFTIETLAEELPGARVIVQDSFGNYWVSQTAQGTVTQLEMQDGKVIRKNAVFRGMNRPHGLVIDPRNGLDLYIAEETKISRARLYSDAPLETVSTLPAGGRHYTRMLGLSPENKLIVSIGSTCDVCEEADKRHAAIITMNTDGSDQKIMALGLRNAVFFTWQPGTQKLFATEMGRDFLGDHLPPEEINIITNGAHYGWPFCIGKQIRDTKFQPGTNYDCSKTTPPVAELPAHIAPLGLTFIPNQGWSSAYAGDLLVAEHGSWNSSTKVGYKIVRIPFNAAGMPDGAHEDFLTGFLSSNGTILGRPVGLLIDNKDSSLLITDDKRGAVYRVRPVGH